MTGKELDAVRKRCDEARSRTSLTYILESWRDVPDLLAEVKRKDAEIERLEGICARARDNLAAVLTEIREGRAEKPVSVPDGMDFAGIRKNKEGTVVYMKPSSEETTRALERRRLKREDC